MRPETTAQHLRDRANDIEQHEVGIGTKPDVTLMREAADEIDGLNNRIRLDEDEILSLRNRLKILMEGPITEAYPRTY